MALIRLTLLSPSPQSDLDRYFHEEDNFCCGLLALIDLLFVLEVRGVT